jgi:acyl-CoA synthetase (NDP forming)
MEKFFHPNSVVVFGVSDTPANHARIIVQNLIHFGFTGNIYPVGAKGGSVSGKEIQRNIDEIPETPDLAVILVPARYVPSTLEACGMKGIRHVIIESGGFSEFADERRTLDEEILHIAKKYATTVIGPNCFGTINIRNGIVLPFFILDREYMKQGNTSLVSQSGGVFYDTCMLCSVENIGLNKLVSLGNKLITDENSFFEYLIKDPTTHVIGFYLESFSDGRRFMEFASGNDKPVVLLKGNRTAKAHTIAKFHTTALAGDDAVMVAAMKQAGIHQVTNFQEMIDAFKIFSLPVLRGPRLALISRSGGHGVLSADAAHRYGFELSSFSDGFFTAMKAMKLNIIETTNPLDIGDVYDLNEYGNILELALKEPDVDGVAFVATYSSESDGEKIRNFIRYAARITPIYKKPTAICVATNRREWFSVKESADFPVFVDIDQALKALKSSYEHHRHTTLKTKEHADRTMPSEKKTNRLPSGFMSPADAFALLELYGLPAANCAVVKNAQEGLTAAEHFGYPVALKLATPYILHKTEVGGVELNIAGPEALKEAFLHMSSDLYLLQKMAPPGAEMIVGARYDREFGHVILLGLGGIFVEILKDTAIRVVPINGNIAREMIDELKGTSMLKGYRGKPPADVGALEGVLVNISQLLTEHPEVADIDVNPVIVLEQGKGCVIVDAKIRVT